ncbi:MAG: hypothetical protein LBS35_14405, partial [Synergistaceae bacterium]|nr:hypothetical protein [Synergistaceae bacterium]
MLPPILANKAVVSDIVVPPIVKLAALAGDAAATTAKSANKHTKDNKRDFFTVPIFKLIPPYEKHPRENAKFGVLFPQGMKTKQREVFRYAM